MGEQAHTQIEALPKPESQIEKSNSHQDSNSHPSPPKSDPNLQILHPQPATSVPEASHTIPTEISHYNPHNPSKISICPQKVRKLSAQATAAVKLATDD